VVVKALIVALESLLTSGHISGMPTMRNAQAVMLTIGNTLLRVGCFEVPGLQTIMVALYDAYKRHESLPLFPPGVELSEYELVIDVGAGLGFFTDWVLRHTTSRTRIIACEPAPKNFKLLQARIARLGSPERVTIRQLAVSHVGGAAELSLNLGHFGDHAVRMGELAGEIKGRRSIRVHAATLSEIIAGAAEVQGRALVKLDVQGHEGHILAGLRRDSLGERRIDLLTEYSPAHLSAQGTPPREFIAELLCRSSRVRAKNSDGSFSDVLSDHVEVSDYTDFWCEDLSFPK
jgi:FkbM family methyltransferase